MGGVVPPHEEKNKLVNKVKRLLRRAGLPRWLHRCGPKKYEFWQHAFALLIKQECKLSYRRASRLLNDLGLNVPTYSALAKMIDRISLFLWQKILKITAGQKLNLVAIDGTGLSRPLPSPYYYWRIDKPYPIDVGTKLSLAICTKTKKILAVRFRAKPRHDIKDAKYLLKRLPTKPKKLVADKGYDARWLHDFCASLGIEAHIPLRNYGKPRFHNLSRRMLSQKSFNKKTYNRRNMVESTIKSIKAKFGTSVSSIKVSAQRAEIYCRAIAHNIIGYLKLLFQLSRLYNYNKCLEKR